MRLLWHICQAVCPFNRPASSAHPTLVATTEAVFQPRASTTGRTLSELALLSEEEFRQQFKGSPVKRAKRGGLLRNVATAMEATDSSGSVRALDVATSDTEPLIGIGVPDHST